MVYMSTCRAMAILGLLAVITTSFSAAFSDEDVQRYDDVIVIARQSEAHSFEMSAELTAKVKDEFRSGVRSWSADTVSKQVHPHRLRRRLQDYESEVTPRRLQDYESEVSLQACQASTCAQCTNYKKTFTQSFCFGVTGTNCIVIKSLGDAHISYYNKDGCNGNSSDFVGCGKNGTLAAPGTNAIEFQVGC